ncbi:MAG TPA: glucose 1-dehydrogenase [Leifsonia sp.]|nr:glucose 1-dehydrogenase [Leifsonia sp.]
MTDASTAATGTIDALEGSPFSLAGSAALVTGATRGLGRAIALELARAGADVAIGMRNPGDDDDLVAEIERFGVRALPVRMDVLDLPESRAAISQAAADFGHIDILVNNAGGGISEPAIDVSEEDFDAVWALNTRSTFFLSQHAARLMRASGGGSIVNIASQAGLVALPGEASYCISKAAVVHMTRCLAVEWGEYGIRVNAVAPTFIETDGTSEALSDEAFKADTIERIAALHRIGVPREVSGAVAFLCSPAASLITGQTLAIDGGWTAR